jgi:hypothetical protein
MNNIRISKAKIDHLESLGSLFDQYRQFYNQTPDLERSLSFIKERIERQDSVILIALKTNKTKGGHKTQKGVKSTIDLTCPGC